MVRIVKERRVGEDLANPREFYYVEACHKMAGNEWNGLMNDDSPLAYLVAERFSLSSSGLGEGCLQFD